MVTSDRDCIRGVDLPPQFATQSPLGIARTDERALLLTTLERMRGNKSAAAKALNCSRMTLYRRLARQGLAGAVFRWRHTCHRECNVRLSQNS